MNNLLQPIALAFTCFGCLCSCSSDLPVLPQSVSSPCDYSISLESALASLDDLMADINPYQTKGDSYYFDIGNVFSVKKQLTKSTPTLDSIELKADTLLHIVNFVDGGFAVLSADKRISEPVLIVAEEGELSVEDFLFEDLSETIYTDEQDTTKFEFYNPVDDDYYVSVSDAIKPGRIVAELTCRFVFDELKIIEGDDGNNSDGWFVGENTGGSNGNSSITYEWITEEAIPEMMSTKWGQGEPFNDLCPMKGLFKKKRAPAGCVPVAVGQIMAYHEYPQRVTYNDVLCDYAIMKNVPQNSADSAVAKNVLAHFIRFIGDCCNVDYHKEYAFATPVAAKKCMTTFGYSNVVRTIGYDGNLILESLKKGNPVFIAAVSGLCNGHAWVIDGYMKQNYVSSSGTIHNSRTLLHCNMGWKGLCNGYYASGIFDVRDGATIPDPGCGGTHNRKYDWWYRILTYDSPKK